MDEETLKNAAREYQTPLYVYDGDLIVSRYREFAKAVASIGSKSRVFYAVKANSSLAILDLLRREGSSVDCVSGGEIACALKVGFKPHDILFTSNSKTREEIASAVSAGVNITCGNTEELDVVSEVCAEAGESARVSFRVNPDVDAKTHPKIATGLRDTKFGVHFEGDIAFNAYKRASELEGIDVVGLHAHIGSQITDASSFVESCEKLFEFALRLKNELGMQLEFIDVGGGVGIAYKKDDKPLSPEEYAKALEPAVKAGVESLGYEPTLYFEPGRYIVGPAGVLLCSVNSVKETPSKKFVNVDAGFNTLTRPAMYDAYHRATVLGKKGESETYDIAGNVCESGDILARDRALPKVVRDDIIIFHDAGAYGMSMASEYNMRALPAEVLVKDGVTHLIRERGTQEDLYRKQKTI